MFFKKKSSAGVKGKPVVSIDDEKKRKKLILAILSILLVGIVVVLLLLPKKVDPVLQLSTVSLDFGKEDSEMEFTVRNDATAKGFFQSGVKPLDFEIKREANDNWITVQPVSGGSEGESKLISVIINRTSLTPGRHMGKLRVASNGGNEVLHVLAQKLEEKITIKSPTPKSAFPLDQNVAIKWDATSGLSNSVNIYLYLNDSKVGVIAKEHNYSDSRNRDGEFLWLPDNRAIRGGSNYTIRIEDTKDPKIYSEVGPVKLSQPITAIHVLNKTPDHQFPNTVQFIFSLRNQYNHAILLDSNEADWKNIKIWENEGEIDYLESHALLYSQEAFQLQVMIVLDFSASMHDTKGDIENLVMSANALIDNLNETHQVGVVEFHRPDKAPVLLQSFTTYKDAAKEAIDGFASGKFYSDFSICWDAVQKGIELFPEHPNPNIFKTLVFLSDGFDNSSFSKPADLVAAAKAKKVHLFVVGVGSVHEENILKGIAYETGGTYVHSESIDVLRERFKQTIKDIKGQYKIKYISPHKPEDGKFNVASEISYNNVTGQPGFKDIIDPASFFRKTINGVIRFTAPSVIKYNKADVFMWCEHVPRYINEFRFWIGLKKPFKVLQTSFNDGGLCQDWTLKDEGDGWYRLTSPNQAGPHKDLEFGDFGTICKIVVDNIDAKGLAVPFELDNSIYDRGQAFYGEDDTSPSKVMKADIYVGKMGK